MTRLSFNAVVHARPAAAKAVAGVKLRGLELTRLDVAGDVVGPGFPRSFEEAVVALARLPRMFVEPDGSFVWVGSDGAGRWQLDGLLFDRDGRLLYAELKGDCPANALDDFLATLGDPPAGLMYQLAYEAVFFDDSEFRRFASATG